MEIIISKCTWEKRPGEGGRQTRKNKNYTQNKMHKRTKAQNI